MSGILDLGVQVVIFIQSLGSWLLTPMKLFTLLGTPAFYLLIIPALFWCISFEAGLRLGLFLMLSGGVNDILKIAFHSPRPYWYSSKVKALAAETSFGVPSGHAQNAVVMWGSLATWIKHRWVWIAAILLIFFISLSRLYLGVHFPTDILAGWLIGICFVWGLLRYERRITAWFTRQPVGIQCLAALLTSLIILGLGIATRLALGNWQFPLDWLVNASRAGGGIPAPLDLADSITNTGALLGMLLGAIGVHRNGGFASAEGTLWQKVARYTIGLAGTLLVWYGLGKVLESPNKFLSDCLHYLQFALVGLWFTGIAPVVFIRLGLATRKI